MFKRWGSIEIHQLQITKKQTNKTEILKDYTQKESKKSFRLDSKKKRHKRNLGFHDFRKTDSVRFWAKKTNWAYLNPDDNNAILLEGKSSVHFTREKYSKNCSDSRSRRHAFSGKFEPKCQNL